MKNNYWSEFKKFKVNIWRINRKFPSSNILEEENAWQSVQYVIEIFTFILTARTNLIFIQHPHLQVKILCLCLHDVLPLSYSQSIYREVTITKIISSALTFKNKYYKNLSVNFSKTEQNGQVGFLPITVSQLLCSSKYRPWLQTVSA